MSGDVTKVLLGLYESLNTHQHLEDLIDMLGSWLSDTDEQLEILRVEECSQTVLSALNDRMIAEQTRSQKTASPTACFDLHTAPEAFCKAVETTCDAAFPSDDYQRITTFLNSTDSHCLTRLMPDGGDPILALFVKNSETPDIIEMWSDNELISDTVRDLLEDQIGISGAEFQVLEQIASGARVSEIAQRLGKSSETIRSQVKSIAAKIGVTGQIEIASAVQKLESITDKVGDIHLGRGAGEEQITLRDGRRLTYSEYGPRTGTPVLYFHCFLHGRHLPQDIEPELKRRNIRIISAARAGYGPSCKDTADVATVVAKRVKDYADLARHFGAGRYHLMAHGTGFLFAYQFAMQYPELSRKLIGLDAVPPANTWAQISQLKGLFRSVTLTMNRAPGTFALLVKLSLRRLQSFNNPAKKMRRHLVFPNIPIDEIETEAGLEAATLNVREMMRNGMDPFIIEARAFSSNWANADVMTNVAPQTSLFYTKDNPFVSKKGARAFSDMLTAPLIELDDTYPFLTPSLTRIIDQFEKVA